ncbi:hypothetical protein EBR21_17855 [bacterium]|nr:hypothetical protein [bacterium]
MQACDANSQNYTPEWMSLAMTCAPVIAPHLFQRLPQRRIIRITLVDQTAVNFSIIDCAFN